MGKVNRPRRIIMAFTPGFNLDERVAKKTKGESVDTRCVDGEVKGEGQRRDFGHCLYRKRDGSNEKTVQQRYHGKD